LETSSGFQFRSRRQYIFDFRVPNRTFYCFPTVTAEHGRLPKIPWDEWTQGDVQGKFAVVVKKNDRLTFPRLQQHVPPLKERPEAVEVFMRIVVYDEAVTFIGEHDEAYQVAFLLQSEGIDVRCEAAEVAWPHIYQLDLDAYLLSLKDPQNITTAVKKAEAAQDGRAE